MTATMVTVKKGGAEGEKVEVTVKADVPEALDAFCDEVAKMIESGNPGSVGVGMPIDRQGWRTVRLKGGR